jgi:glutamine amidotransferase-like protein
MGGLNLVADLAPSGAAHRGPDDKGLHGTSKAVLEATRLAMRGLADGRQPMVDAESGVVVVCNGEIDNHAQLRSWRSGSRGHPSRKACRQDAGDTISDSVVRK